ncbi:MAG: hypothetical protein JWN50_312 [Parcubacteria group bacterium]|nr:hypothetical protein [Parcubacteria group bacterium]
MTIAVRPVRGPSFQELVSLVDAVTHNFGFHTLKDTARNQETWTEFQERMHIFKGQLHYKEGARCTPGSLDTQIYYTKRRPLDRTVKVPNDKINELTLAWMCVFLRYSYRTSAGLHQTLSRLKTEVVWLLGRFGYDLLPESDLMKMSALHWDEAGLIWRIVQGNDGALEAAL